MGRTLTIDIPAVSIPTVDSVRIVAEALGITYSAARAVLNRETNVYSHSRRTIDRDRFLHRRGVMP